MAEKTPVEQLTYKQASQELELIIRSLESGDMELEESLESYTRGVELLKSLRTRLSDAEQKVSVLLKDVDGNDVLADGEAANTDDNLSFLSNHLAAYFGVVFLGRGFFEYPCATARQVPALAKK